MSKQRPIKPSEAKEIPATTFDEIRLKQVHIAAEDPAKPAGLDAVLVYSRTLPDGVTAEDSGEGIRLHLRDLFAEADFDHQSVAAVAGLFKGLTEDEALGLGLTALQLAIEAVAKDRNLI